MVILGLSLFLTFYIMAPYWSQANENGLQPYLAGEITQEEAVDRTVAPLREFMFKQTREADLALFVNLSDAPRAAGPEEVSTFTQIPALLISTATGIIVTRAAYKSNLGYDLIHQLGAKPRVFYIVCGVLIAMACVPGLPGIPFAILAAICGLIGRQISSSDKKVQETAVVEKKEKTKTEANKPENIVSLLQVDPMELEIGYSLISLVDTGQGGYLLERIVMLRRQCALELSLVVPTIRIRDNIQIKPNAYIIKLKGIEIAKGELLLDHYLPMNSGTVFEEIQGIDTIEPAFGLPALWIPEVSREQAELNGYTVVDAVSVLATHFTEVIKAHADEILGRQEPQNLIDNAKK